MKQMHIFWNTYIVSLYVDDCAVSMCENAYKKSPTSYRLWVSVPLPLCVKLTTKTCSTVQVQRQEVSSPLCMLL